MKRNQTEFLKLCLADALIKLMTDKPFENISVNAIYEKAGVGRTTFYKKYGEKAHGFTRGMNRFEKI